MKLKLWEIAYKDYTEGKKYAEIAEKYKVTTSCVKSWASRYWKKLQPEKAAELAGRKHVGAPFGNHNARGHGAPKGNKNAVGKKCGAPKGNKNHLKTGEHMNVSVENFDRTELAIFNQAPEDPIEAIDYTIRLLSVREHRMLKLRDELLAQREALRKTGESGDLIEDEVKTVETFKGRKESTHAAKTSERRLTEKILAIEDALTRVQEKKIRAIESKFRMTEKKQSDYTTDKNIHITIKRKERDA